MGSANTHANTRTQSVHQHHCRTHAKLFVLRVQLLWNTGNWEFPDTNDHWDDYWKYVFVQRHANAMLQLKWQQSVKKFVWVTTADMHPGPQNRFGQTEETLRRHTQWWNTVGTLHLSACVNKFYIVKHIGLCCLNHFSADR